MIVLFSSNCLNFKCEHQAVANKSCVWKASDNKNGPNLLYPNIVLHTGFKIKYSEVYVINIYENGEQ